MKQRPPACNGTTLLLTLVAIALLAILVVSVLVTSTTDSKLSSTALDAKHAEQFAMMGVDTVVEKLQSIPLDRHWAAAPGRVRVWEPDGGENSHEGRWNAINLYSEGTTDLVDLNAMTPEGIHPILSPNEEYPVAPVMQVPWIYVLSDGRQISDQAELESARAEGMVVVGRFAFWADIENGRVNINTAGFGMVNRLGQPFVPALQGSAGFNANSFVSLVLTPNPWRDDRISLDAEGKISFLPANRTREEAQRHTLQNLVAHPSSIDLSFLDGISEEESFDTFRYAGSYFLRNDTWITRAGSVNMDQNDRSIRFFQEPSDWINVLQGSETERRAKYERNKGYITTQGRSPDMTPWGTHKFPLSMTLNDANPQNDLSEQSGLNIRRASWWAPPADTRLVQFPAIEYHQHWNQTQRASFRDIMGPNTTNPSQRNNNAYQRLGRAFKWTLNQTFPEYDRTLFDKYNEGNPVDDPEGEIDQIFVEIANFVADTQSWGMDGHSHFFNRFQTWQAGADQNYYNNEIRIRRGLGLERAKFPLMQNAGGYSASTANPEILRMGTSGQGLINEIGFRAEARPNAVGLLVAPGEKVFSGGPLTHYRRIHNSGHTWRAVMSIREAVGPRAAGTNGPEDPGSSGDFYIFISGRGNMFIPQNWGLGHRRDFGAHTRPIYLPDCLITWQSTDPASASGSLRLNFRSPNVDAPGWIVNPAMGHWMFETPYAASRATAPHSLPIGYELYFGPFEAGSEVEFTISARFRNRIFIHGGYSGAIDSTYEAAILPGILPDFRMDEIVQVADPADDSQSTLLEFPFPPPDSGLPPLEMVVGRSMTVTRVADDPRLKKAEHWTLAPPNSFLANHFNSSVYTGGLPSDGAGWLASDVSRPNSTIQHVRGRMRHNAVGSGGEVTAADFQAASRILGTPGVGYLSSIPTGVNRGIPWKTMNFGVSKPDNATEPWRDDDPPDWLLWNLFFVPFDRTYANHTDGRVNINTTLFPFETPDGEPLRRVAPLEALLGNRVANASTVAANIAARRLSSGALPLVGPDDMFIYPGQVAQIAGVADQGQNEFENESVPRDIADIVTTQSSDFRVFAIGQTLQQREDGTLVALVTRRIEAVASRITDSGLQQFAFGTRDGEGAQNMMPTVPVPLQLHRRGEYRNALNSSSEPPLFQVTTTAQLNSLLGASLFGLDRLPNTPDDPLIPQKVHVSRFHIKP